MTSDQKTIKDLTAALEAIRARINGEWDHPALMPAGPLSISSNEDILKIASNAIAQAKEGKP